MNPFRLLSHEQQATLFRGYFKACLKLRDKVEEAYLSRLEPAPVPMDVISRVSTNHVEVKLFEALSLANQVLEALKERHQQNRLYYQENPQELAVELERVIHVKYKLECSYTMHLHDLKRTLHQLQQT